MENLPFDLRPVLQSNNMAVKNMANTAVNGKLLLAVGNPIYE